MKPLRPDCPLALQTLHRGSPIYLADLLAGSRTIKLLAGLWCVLVPFGYRAIAFLKNRAEICAPTCLAALLFASIPAANADNLGRLFFTPAQRAQLDYNYARNAPAEGNSSSVLTVNGIVQKNGGARTVWVNGVAQSAGKSNESTPTTQTVTIPGKSHPVKIKVGQKILLDQPAPTRQDAAVE